MWKKLFGKRPIPVWVIKQVDREQALLHLCGEGHLLPAHRRERDEVIGALQRGDYRGPVTMADNGAVLNARLFAALVPRDGLHLGADGQAHWRGRRWRIASTPQRCWTYEGRLVAAPAAGAPHDLVSGEDVSDIRRRASAEAALPSGPRFAAADELEGEAAFAARRRRGDAPRHEEERPHDDP